MIDIVRNSFYIHIHILSHDYNLVYTNFETLTTHYHQQITQSTTKYHLFA